MYYFYLGNIQLPVTPAKLQMKISNQNKTISLINEGEINFLKLPGLTEITFDAVFPNVKRHYANYSDGFKHAEDYLLLLKEYKLERKPFPFVVSRFTPSGEWLFGNSMLVSLEDYKITEDAKKGFDVEVSIKLKEYREFITEKIE